MVKYLNLHGNSGIAAYEITSTTITVQFNDGMVYRYSYASAGSRNIEQMKNLAIAGAGLNSFINTHTRKLYESKLR